MAGDDEFFSDDELDIPDNTLQELEQNAISSTQRAKPVHAQPVRPVQKQFRGVAPLNRAGSVNQKLPWRPPQPRPIAQAAPPAKVYPRVQAQQAPPPSAPDPPSSDYGFDDGDVIDLDESSTVIEPAPQPPTRPKAQTRPSAAIAATHGSKAALDPETEAAFAQADAELGIDNGARWSRAPSVQPQQENGIDVSALQARVAELEAQQARLNQLEQEARSAAAAKQGEIAIVRANQEKGAKEYERRIAVLQKLHADDTAKHKAELEAARKEREKIQTNNRFLEHDLAQETAKRLNGPGKARTASVAKGDETPRKARRTNLADGFEEDEVLVVSPSKGRERAKDQTPKAGSKRKRTAPDSPIAPLSFKQPAHIARQETDERPQPSAQELPSRAVQDDDRLDFMQRLLNHRPQEGHDRSVEALAKHFFPSKPTESLSSVLMNELTLPTVTKEPDYFPLKLARIMLKLWACCVREKHFPSFYLILDLLRFALYSELSSVTSQLIEEALPLCVRSCEMIATPVVSVSSKVSIAVEVKPEVQKQLNENIDVDEVLEFLQQLCQAATLVDGRLEAFWQRLDLSFTLLMLSKAQPINQIIVTLQVLATSALPTSFSTITGDPETQAQVEWATIDRLSCLLSEMPEVPKDEVPYTEEEIAELRLETLNVFQALCHTDHGALILVQHVNAVGRLMRFLDGQVNKLYMLPPGTAAPDHQPPSAHDLVIKTINQTTRLLYYLLRTFDDSVDFLQKLREVSGAYDKFLISMTRVAFSEQLVFEHGIEDDVTEAAHSILDNLLTPEEGEAVVMAVETPRGTKGTSIGREVNGSGNGDEMTEVDGDAHMSDPG